MNNVRFAKTEDVKSLSFIHAQTWKEAYKDYITESYLETISEEKWVPFFTEAIDEKLYNVVLYNLEGKNTGCITFGKARGDITCNTGDSCNSSVNGNSCSFNNKVCSSSKEIEVSCISNPKEAEIISLYVLPEFWSSKQGYKLTKFALDSLKSQGYSKCYLWVIDKNEKARSFYERLGFKNDEGEITINLGGKDVTEVRYSIDLA